MLKAILVLTTFVACVTAQGIKIAAPLANADLFAGESFVVDIDRPPTLTGSQEVSVAIGLLPCTSGSCDGVDTAGNIGRLLTFGSYAPTLVGNGRADLAENYTVTVPANFNIGPAILSVAHFALIIGSEPFLEVVPQVVNIVQ